MPEVWKTAAVIAGAVLSVGFTAFMTGFTQAKIGQAGCGAMAEKPEVAGTVFILVAIPETMVVLGFVVGAMILMFIKV
ncbi:MAG: ATPase [Candidatus Firestonebacteria bacterium]|nr:ATPase [Candidatus Firestonebacteria bacterium]